MSAPQKAASLVAAAWVTLALLMWVAHEAPIYWRVTRNRRQLRRDMADARAWENARRLR